MFLLPLHITYDSCLIHQKPWDQLSRGLQGQHNTKDPGRSRMSLLLPVCRCDFRSRRFSRNKDMRMCKGEGKRARTAGRITIQIGENRRTQFFASHGTVRFTLSIMNRWHSSPDPCRRCQHMPCTLLTLMERLCECGYVIKKQEAERLFSLKDYEQ